MAEVHLQGKALYMHRINIDIHARRYADPVKRHALVAEGAELTLREQNMVGMAELYLRGKVLHPKQNHNLIVE